MNHKLNLFVIGFLIIISWYKIIFTTFTGEGYYYFPNGFFNQKFPHIFNYDEGARLLFDIFKVTFRDNIFFYHLFLLVILIVLGFVFYFMVHKLTDNKNISLISSILFTINGSLFEFLGMGAYQAFAQRIVWFPLLFGSFTFYIQFFKTEKYKYYIYSIVLYTCAMYLAEFSMFFLPFYLTYIISFCIWERKFSRKHLINISLTLSYAIVTFIIFYLDKTIGGISYGSSNFIEFLFTKTGEIIDLILRQLVILTVPSQIAHALLSNAHQGEYFEKMRYFLYGPVLLLYLGSLWLVLKRSKNLRIIALSSLIFIPIVFILNIFVREEYMLVYEDGSRYMFVPSIGFAIFWGIFIYTFCRRTFLKIGTAILLLYLVFNIGTISAGIERYEPRFKGTKISLKYIKSISHKFSDDSIIIIPSVLGDYGPDFVRYFYARKNNFIAPYFRDWQNEIKRPIDPKKDFILNYDYNKGLIDETDKFNEIAERRKKGNFDIQ